jgi:hypothetical protein
MMKVISLGLGVQSTAMYLMSSLDEIERADYAIFADPGAEDPKTYEILDRLKSWAKQNNGIEIIVNDEMNLYEDLLDKDRTKRFAGIPAFVDNTNKKGMLRRQCTNHYKIRPVIKSIRKIYGLKPKFRMPMTEVWLGISMDEIQRMKTSTLPRVTYRYPLIDNRLDRKDCVKIFEKYSFPTPPKSACVFCPYRSDRGWKQIKESDKESWKKIINIDESIRNSLIDRDKGKGGIYLHTSLKHIDDVDFGDQQELFMCEEGFCGL